MATLHILGIGGTGSRVLRSLTMLLATGVKCTYDIRPVIIDPDHANEDLTRSSKLMKLYKDIRKELTFDTSVKNKFFQTFLNVDNSLRMPIVNTTGVKFKDYIKLSNMPEESKALMAGLYSDDDMESLMDVGFEGHPNRGSLVLSQLSEQQEFKDFANSFNQGDRIFIIGSIFGGTGASGLPLLIKMMRDINGVSNAQLLKTAPIGALVVLPYFRVKADDNSPIDSATFISKTRSALRYYERTISSGNTLQAMYYIGDQPTNQYDNNKGGVNQKNNAHFVELASALAIIDFAKQGFDGMPPYHKEFGVASESKNEIIFSNLGSETRNLIQVPMMQMEMVFRLFEYHFDKMKSQSYVIDRNIDGNDYLQTQWTISLKDFLGKYQEWLNEMNDNSVKFGPFKLNQDNGLERDQLAFVKGFELKRGLLKKKGFDYLDAEITKAETSASNKNDVFMDKLYQATQKIAQEYKQSK